MQIRPVSLGWTEDMRHFGSAKPLRQRIVRAHVQGLRPRGIHLQCRRSRSRREDREEAKRAPEPRMSAKNPARALPSFGACPRHTSSLRHRTPHTNAFYPATPCPGVLVPMLPNLFFLAMMQGTTPPSLTAREILEPHMVQADNDRVAALAGHSGVALSVRQPEAQQPVPCPVNSCRHDRHYERRSFGH